MSNLIKISDHVKIMEHGIGDRPVFGYIYGEEHAIVVDGGCSPRHAAEFLRELTEEEKSKIIGVYLTHGHWDHFVGAFAISDKVYCNPETAAIIKEADPKDYSVEAINKRYEEGKIIDFGYKNMLIEFTDQEDDIIFGDTIIVDGKKRIDLGGVSVSFEPIDTYHCNHCSVLYVNEDKVLFAGDCLWPNMEGNMENWKYSILAFEKLKNDLSSYNADIIIDSHDRPVSSDYMYGWMDKILYWQKLGQEKVSDNKELISKTPEDMRQYVSCYDDIIMDACRYSVL